MGNRKTEVLHEFLANMIICARTVQTNFAICKEKRLTMRVGNTSSQETVSLPDTSIHRNELLRGIKKRAQAVQTASLPNAQHALRA